MFEIEPRVNCDFVRERVLFFHGFFSLKTLEIKSFAQIVKSTTLTNFPELWKVFLKHSNFRFTNRFQYVYFMYYYYNY